MVVKKVVGAKNPPTTKPKEPKKNVSKFDLLLKEELKKLEEKDNGNK